MRIETGFHGLPMSPIWTLLHPRSERRLPNPRNYRRRKPRAGARKRPLLFRIVPASQRRQAMTTTTCMSPMFQKLAPSQPWHRWRFLSIRPHLAQPGVHVQSNSSKNLPIALEKSRRKKVQLHNLFRPSVLSHECNFI